MATGERRLGSGRRGMTVLGKIPTPSVPKPINLPSQRLENRGLEPNVELVPRGTFSWGSAGKSNTVSVSKEKGSPPTSAVAWNGALKIQDLTASSKDAGSLADSNRPSSAGSSTRPSSAPTAATTRVWGSSAKTKVEVQVQTSGFTVNSVEPVSLGSQESTDLTPQPTNGLLDRPTSAGGTVVDRDIHPHPGVDAHANVDPNSGSGPEGFQHPGDGYNFQKNHHRFVWQGMPPAGGYELPVGGGPYSGPLPHEVYYSPFGVAQYGNVKDRDMVVVRMVNGPGVYGGYPPHLRPAECFGPPGMYGSYRHVTRHIEQFAMSGNGAMGTSSCNPGMSIGFFPDGNKYSFQEGDGQFGTVPREGGYPGLQRDVDSIHNISSVSTYGTEWNHRMPRTFGRHNHVSEEHGNHAKDGVASFAMPVPEKKITLLTKMPRVEARSTETKINNSTLLLDSSQGSECGQQKTEMSNIEAENVTTVFDDKCVEKVDEFLERKNLDRGVVKTNTRTISFSGSEIKQDSGLVNCTKDDLSKDEARVTETFPSRSPKTWRKATGRNEVNDLSSTEKLHTSTNIQDSELKAHVNRSDLDSHCFKISKQARDGADSSTVSESTGTGSKAVCTEPTKPTEEEDVSCIDDQKTKMKALSHKSEKEWRPKSPLVQSKASGLRVAKGGKRNELACNAESVKLVSSEECSTGSVMLDASSPLQTQKADKKQLVRNIESLSPSAVSDINSIKEAPFLLMEDSNSAHSQVAEGTVDQPNPSDSERTSVLAACFSARSANQVLHPDTFKVVATEGLNLKGNSKAKTRQSNHKGEKEWRPKSPAVNSAATSDNVSGSEANVTSTSASDVDTKSILELKFPEQEGLQPIDAYDYEGQRAKLKEIAAQRAKQRRKEEEERTKERRAKALAKLDELNRRTLANPMSLETVEYGSMVCVDEVPNKKTKRKLNSSRHSFVDVPIHDSGTLEKHHIDDETVWPPVKDSTSTSSTNAAHKKYPPKVGEDSNELPSNDAIVPQNLRSRRDEPDRNNSKIAEKRQLHKLLTATSSYQGQRQQFRRERSIHEEDLPSAVHDTEVESSSSKKFGVEIRKGLHGDQQPTDSTQNQTSKVAVMDRNEKSSAVEEHQQLEWPNSSSIASQTGDLQDKGGKAASRRPQQRNVERQKHSKAGELSVLEGLPVATGSPERKTVINAGAGQQSAGSSRSGQKHKSELEACFIVEQAQSLGNKQPTECSVSSDASFGSEKLGRSHMSWRQKSVSHLPCGDKPINDMKKDMESLVGESQDTTTQSQKSHKIKNVGGKGCVAGRHQRGQIQVEVREHRVMEETRTDISAPAISEVTGLDADISKHGVEGKGSESLKIGQSYNSRRQKNITNGSYIFKQAFTKELNDRGPESVAATEEASEGTVDPTHLDAASTSNLHNPIAYTKQSFRAGPGAPPWHKHRSMKTSNATVSPGRVGSQVPPEEHSPSQVVCVSRNRLRSNVASMQASETEQLQETESLPFGHLREGGAQFEAEPTLPVEASAQNHKHQQVYSAKVTETMSDQHSPVSSSKNRSNHTHFENRKMNRHYQTGPQAFRPREQYHDAEFEIGREQRTSRGREKPSRKSQFNGCSTVAELDRRGAEPAVKTEISY